MHIFSMYIYSDYCREGQKGEAPVASDFSGYMILRDESMNPMVFLVSLR